MDLGKLIVLFILCGIISLTELNAQSLVEGNTYALIVGVSQYESSGVPPLEYAHKDAEEFKKYLTSNRGGNVPEENIKLLTNKNATISGINGGIDWLRDEVKENDMVYIYFSGHGDVSKGIHKVGYLLAYDSPERNFPMNSVRIDYINFLANNLSVKLGVKVVIVLDACHSGKVSGSEQERSLSLGEALVAKTEENEVRISSCRPTEKSSEDVAWGNGRGAFSFFLIKGLEGLADKDGDMTVTLLELDKYLGKTVKRDVNRIKRRDQNPVLKGDKSTTLALINVPVAASEAVEGDASLATLGGDKSLGNVVEEESVDPSKEYFNQFRPFSFVNSNVNWEISSNNDDVPSDRVGSLKDALNFNEWKDLMPDQVYERMISEFPVEDGEWSRQLENDVRYRNTYMRDLAIVIHNEVQSALNAYLDGDQEELERRRIYNALNSDFGEYVLMLEVAMKLVSENSILHEIMEMKKHYFAGLDYRLKIARSENRDGLIAEAMTHQEKALALDNKAAYVHNEIGILLNLGDQREKALAKFQDASDIAPLWPVPYSNMSNYYYRKGNYEKGLELSEKALDLQSDLINGHVIRGLSATELKDYLLAEESLLKAVNYNALSYRAFDGLGDVYLDVGRYSESNRNYEIADSIKRGFRLNGILDLSDSDGDGVIDMFDTEIDSIPDICNFNTSKFGNKDAVAHFSYAYELWIRDELELAEFHFKRVIEINSQDPLAYHYLGKLYYKNKNYIAAVHYFELADSYYQSNTQFIDFAAEQFKKLRYKDCEVERIYSEAHYDKQDIDFFLADSYRLLGHYSSAGEIYRQLITDSSKDSLLDNYIPYRKLWELYVERSLYDAAAIIMQEYAEHNLDRASNEIYDMYHKVETRYTQYKAGLLAYNKFKIGDEKDTRRSFNEDGDGVINDPREGDSITVAIVPGTDEKLFFAKGIGDPINNALQSFRKSTDGRTTIFFDSLKMSSIYAKMGELSDANGNFENALRYCELAMEYNSKDATPALNLIGKRLEKNEFTTAYDLLTGLNKRNQIDYVNLTILSKAEVLRGNYMSSDTLHERLMEITTAEYDDMNHFRAMRYLLDEDYVKAAKLFEQLSKDNEDDVDYYYTLSRIYAKMGDRKEGEKYLKKAVKSGFDHYWVLTNDDMIESIRNTKTYKKLLVAVDPFMKE